MVEDPITRKRNTSEPGRSRDRPAGDGPSGPHREGEQPKPMMHGHEKSDPFVVVMKPANEGGVPPEQLVERREGTEGNSVGHDTRRTPGRVSVSHGLDRVRRTAEEWKEERFTALLHHVDAERLRSAYGWLRREASPGADGVTWDAYGEDLERRLEDLHDRVHSGAYRAQPSRRAFIPKPDGRQRHSGHCGAGGQDRPARAGGSAECHLGGRLPWLQLRGSAPAAASTTRWTLAVGMRANVELDSGRYDIAGSLIRSAHDWLIRL